MESQLAEIRAKISPAAFEQWLSSHSTKALKLQLEIDIADLKENWVRSRYIGDEDAKARGEAEYIEGMLKLIPLIRGDDD